MIFTDTSALYAALVVDDRHHLAARRAEASLQKNREQLWTIDPVLTELWVLLRRGAGVVTADRLVSGLLARGLRREALDPEDYSRAWEIAREWPDQQFSLTDRQAFAAMERTRRFQAWSYDADFVTIRLGPRRARALALVR